MTTIALNERWTFDGLDMSSYAYHVRSVQGADDVPALRGDSVPRTGLPGRVDLGGLLDSRLVTLTMFVSPLSAAGVAPVDQRDGVLDNVDALKQTLDPHRGQKTLAQLMPDGTTRSNLARVRTLANFTKMVGGRAVVLAVTLELADPYWYGASTTGPGSVSVSASPTAFTFNNTGLIAGHRTAFDFTGPVTNPRLTNLTNGAWFEVEAVVASTKHLVVDAYAFTAVNDGTDVSGAVTQGSQYPFMELAPGNNSMQVTADATGGSLLVTHYGAFL